MERFRQRAKITGIPDWSSGKRFLRGGSRHVQKQINLPKLVSDSSSCSSGVTSDDSFKFELGQGTSRHASETPMKKLLAKEMSGESESGRRSPSVIAKLMGLDALPPLQSSCKQQKRSSKNHSQRTRSIEKVQRDETFYDGRSSSRSSKDQQEFKDVFEVSETVKMDSSSYSSQGRADLKVTEAELAFIRQKFLDAKRLSTDENLQDSKEFHDVIAVLDSNKDLLLEFLQQPDSLFTKHLQDLQSALPKSNCRNFASMKLSDRQKPDKHVFSKKLEKGTPPRYNNSKSPQHYNGHSRHSDRNHTPCSSFKASKSQLEGKDEISNLPTRIIVLKPNLGRVQSATNFVSRPCSSHVFHSDCGKHTEFPSPKNREAELWGKKKIPNYVGPATHKSRESREIAREITQQMRNNFNTGSINFSSHAFRGYVGEESCNISGNTFANESFDLELQYKSSSSRYKESSVNGEAKKRLSERWKMTHKSQDMGAVSRRSTLAEMLSLPEKEVMTTHRDEGLTHNFCKDYEPDGFVEPLGISSRDGWNEYIEKLSKTPPALSTTFESPKARHVPDTLRADRYLIRKGASKREIANFDRRECLLRKNSRSSNKKSHSSIRLVKESNNTSFEIHCSQNPEKTNYLENDPVEKNVVETSPFIVIDKNPAPQNVMDGRHEKEIMFSESPDGLLPELSTPASVKDNSYSVDQNTLMPEEPAVMSCQENSVPIGKAVGELESPASAKETDRPSPISVLEPPFTDDVSSCSECFESLSADLNGLRMQLRLLKLESEPYTEGPMLVSSDEDLVNGSIAFYDEKRLHMTETSWEYSYIFDVLIDSGFQISDPDTFITAWHSPECPVNPLFFDDLEKKHGDQTSKPRSERKLLFDRINSGIMEIYLQFTDPHPWVRPVKTKVACTGWAKDGIQDDLYKLLTMEEKKVKEDTIETVQLEDYKWLDLGDDIDFIGREMERLLIDELVAEVI